MNECFKNILLLENSQGYHGHYFTTAACFSFEMTGKIIDKFETVTETKHTVCVTIKQLIWSKYRIQGHKGPPRFSKSLLEL